MLTHYHDSQSISGRRLGADRRAFANPNYRGIDRRINPDRRSDADKRKQLRLRAKDLTFVKLSSESGIDIGQLLDISPKGLALRFFVSEETSRDYSELGVFVSGGHFVMDKIPFRPVSDTVLASEFPYSTITFRRYAVQFEKLTPEQKEKLDNFLLNHTLGEA
ncbi:MAG: hypothetical protein KKH68_11370 [Proteobacteria bacterium]|nr:hypothetical protein [Pseudomonadota bacterium]